MNAVKWNRIARPSSIITILRLIALSLFPHTMQYNTSLDMCVRARALLLLLFIAVHTYRHMKHARLQAYTHTSGKATTKEQARWLCESLYRYVSTALIIRALTHSHTYILVCHLILFCITFCSSIIIYEKNLIF